MEKLTLLIALFLFLTNAMFGQAGIYSSAFTRLAITRLMVYRISE